MRISNIKPTQYGFVAIAGIAAILATAAFTAPTAIPVSLTPVAGLSADEGVPQNLITAMKADEGVPQNLVTALKADEGVPQNLVTA
jgi:hypothetical protein